MSDYRCRTGIAPDLFILAGPEATLGGAVVQSLILARARGMTHKDILRAIQDETPVLAFMEMSEQRRMSAATDGAEIPD